VLVTIDDWGPFVIVKASSAIF